jgi:hypothetical protein
MSILLRILDTDAISYGVYGFWRCLGRRFLQLFPVRFRQWWTNHVRTIYAPQHQALRAAIPRTWCDIDGCIEAFLFACVVDFVEGEQGLVDWEQPDQVGLRKEQAAMLREVYTWAKTGRAAAEEATFSSAPKYAKGRDWTTGISGDYGEMMRLSDEMNAKTDRYLLWILSNRNLLWT